MRYDTTEPEQLELPFDPPARPVPPVEDEPVDETNTIVEDDDDDDDFEDDDEGDVNEDDYLPVEEPANSPEDR